MIYCYYPIWSGSSVYSRLLEVESRPLWMSPAYVHQTPEAAWKVFGVDTDRSMWAMIRWEWYGRTNSIGNWYLTNPRWCRVPGTGSGRNSFEGIRRLACSPAATP